MKAKNIYTYEERMREREREREIVINLIQLFNDCCVCYEISIRPTKVIEKIDLVLVF
jgi:hypothetical protein